MHRRSYWSLPGKRYPQLKGSARADVAIIGAGITGCSLAYHLRDSGLKTALLEGSQIGAGATSKNVGALVLGTEHDFTEAVGKFGRRKAGEIWRATQKSLGQLAASARKERISCSLVSHGALVVAMTEHQLAVAENEYKELRRAGFRVSWLEQDELQSYVKVPFLGAVKSPYEHGCNPANFVEGLAIASEAAVFENSVAKLSSRKGSWIVKTPHGRLEAEKVVIATESFTRLAGIRMIHRKDTAMAAGPLPEKFFSEWWPSNQMIWNIGRHYHTFRRLPNRAVLFHASEGAQKGLHHFFPSARAHITHEWNCKVAGFPGELPRIGEHPAKPGLYFSLGYRGHGLVFGWLGGSILAKELAGKKRPTKLFAPE